MSQYDDEHGIGPACTRCGMPDCVSLNGCNKRVRENSMQRELSTLRARVAELEAQRDAAINDGVKAIRELVAKVAATERERDEVAAAYERGWNKETHVLKMMLAAARKELGDVLENLDLDSLNMALAAGRETISDLTASLAAANADRARLRGALETARPACIECQHLLHAHDLRECAASDCGCSLEHRKALKLYAEVRWEQLAAALAASDAAAWLRERDMRVAEAVALCCADLVRNPTGPESEDGYCLGDIALKIDGIDLAAVVAGVK